MILAKFCKNKEIFLNIAIFGGSFDPPHKGHGEIVKNALKELDIDKLIIVPTFCSPFKEGFCATPALRFSWCEALWAGNSKILISDFEINRGEATASITSVRHFKELFNPKKIYLIIGADCLESLPKWSEYESLKKIVEFVVATRDDISINADFLEQKALKILKINVKISSSKMRQELDFCLVDEKIKAQVKEFYARKN